MGKKKHQSDLDTQNIFDELTGAESIQAEVEKIESYQEKDVFYYLKKFSSLFFTVNVVLFLGIIISMVYIFIQESESKKEYTFLKPLCFLFLGEKNIETNTCYGVTPILQEYRKKLSLEQKEQSEIILPLLSEIYSIENFNFSPRASFLLEKSENRLRSLEILSAFDELKTRFAPRDKAEITCFNISISQDSVLELSCDIFSSDWDASIVGLEDGNIATLSGGGTSVSRASSFVSFIESYPNSPFQVLSKPEAFSVVSVQNGPYTKKTSIQLRLAYNTLSSLSF